MFIGFTGLMVKLRQSGDNIGEVIQTEQNEQNNELETKSVFNQLNTE